MKLTEAIKNYFSRYDDENEDADAKAKAKAESESNLKKVYKKKKKKKKTRAGSYNPKAREQYEKDLQAADEY